MRRASAASRCICAASASSVGEVLLVTQLRHELHFDLPPVQVARKNRTRAPRAASASRPTVGRVPRLATPRNGVVSTRARGPRKFPVTGVRRRSMRRFAVGKPRSRPSRCPWTTRPRIDQGRPSQRSASAKSPRPARRAHRCCSCARRPSVTGGHDIDRKTQSLTRLGQHGGGGFAIAAEAEVVTDDHRPGAQVPRQQARKGLPREVTQASPKRSSNRESRSIGREDPPALA